MIFDARCIGMIEEKIIPQAFFSVVGNKQNESYEKLLDLLPTVRDCEAHDQISAATPVSSVPPVCVQTPEIHPLRQEWLDAAEEVSDLPTLAM